MAKLRVQLDEESSDKRSAERAFKLTIINTGSQRVEVQSLSPRMPDDVELIARSDTTILSLKRRQSKLCSEMSQLINEIDLSHDEELKLKIFQLIRSFAKEAEKDLTGIRLFQFKLLSTYVIKKLSEFRSKTSPLFTSISNLTDAEHAWERIPQVRRNEAELSIFGAKLLQLKEVSQQINDVDPSTTTGLITIQPQMRYGEVYVLRFSRRLLENRIFPISLTVTYRDGTKSLQKADNPTQSEGVSLTVEIPPMPLAMSLVAGIGGALGGMLKYGETFSIQVAANIASYFPIIVAVVVYSTFDYLDVFKSLRNKFNWRVALLVGFTCGYANDRILKAFTALIQG